MQVMKTILFLILINFAFFVSGSERVVSLSPALTELVCHLGCEKKLIGRSDVCNYPHTVRKIPVAGRFADPNVEKIIKMQPTLLITNDLINPNIAKTFEKRGIKTAILKCRNISEYKDCVKKLSVLLNVPQAGKKELKRIDFEMKAKRNVLPLNVLWVIWDSPLMVAGQNSLPDEVIRLSGAKNVAGQVAQAYFKCSFDWLLKQETDVIIWSASPNGYNRHRFWKKMKAVQQNKLIIDLDPDLLQRPGPRIFEGIRLLREKLEKMQ